MKTLGKILLRGALTGAVAGLIITGMGWVFLEGLDREAARQEEVRRSNCQHYGAFINKQAGREVCPPTPQG